MDISCAIPLTEFFSAYSKSAWVEHNKMKVYVRRAKHAIDGAIIDTFDIANILTPEELRGQGTFRRFLVEIEEILKDSVLRKDIKAIYIENVLNSRLAASCRKWGFIEISFEYGLPSFYILL